MRLRHLAAGLLAFALLAPTGAAAPLIDQLDNGGFEDGLAEWRSVAGETETTGEAYEGETAAKLNAVGDTTTTTLAQEVSLDNEDAPTVPNAEYEFSFAALLNDGADNAATVPPAAYGQIVWKNELGETSRIDKITIADTDTYAEHTQTFRAPEDATRADVQFHLVRENVEDRTDANLKVDAVSFGPADPAEGADDPGADCLQIYYEREVGPVTVTYNCGLAVDVDEDWRVLEEVPSASGPPCNAEEIASAGPLTVSKGHFCEPRVDYDEDWQPSLEQPDGHEDDPFACALKDSDTVGEAFWCFFGPPGP